MSEPDTTTTDDDRYGPDQLGTAAEATPAGRAAEGPGEDADVVRPSGGDRGGVVGRDDLDGDVGADAVGAVGRPSVDAGLDEDVPGAAPEPADPGGPRTLRNDMGEQWRDG
jgi:hypothetical protein